MKKKKLVIAIIVVVGILSCFGIYFGYKAFLLSFYRLSDTTQQEYQKLLSGYQKRNEWQIQHNNQAFDKMISYENVQFFNLFEGFEKTEEEDYDRYALKDENGNFLAHFTVSITDPYLSYVGKDAEMFLMDENEIDIVTSDDFSERKKLKDDIDFFDYLIKHQAEKHTLLTPVKQIKEDHYVQLLSYIMLPSINSITILNGDLDGYILNLPDLKEVSILQNGKRYVFSFIGLDYFTDDRIKEFLSSVAIQ